MITDLNTIEARPHLRELYGLSTDEKPTGGVSNASAFYEMDTKKVFLFDEENAQWLEQ